MRSLSRYLPQLTAALFLSSSMPLAAAPAREPSPAAEPARPQSLVPADPTAVPATPDGSFRYGPIQTKDPEVRGQIRKLYRDQSDLETAARVRLGELVAAAATETDGDARLGIQREMIQVKKDLQLASTEIGLEIALLNADEPRVAEFQKALDQLRNPEKYLPEPQDPSVARERARQLGLEQ